MHVGLNMLYTYVSSVQLVDIRWVILGKIVLVHRRRNVGGGQIFLCRKWQILYFSFCYLGGGGGGGGGRYVPDSPKKDL